MFRIHYTQHQHGWATASVTDGVSVVEMDVSYLSDGLGDLARAARRVLQDEIDATFGLKQEPGEHRFTFARAGERVRIEVCQSPEMFSRVKNGQSVFVTECDSGAFATACINCLRHVYDELGAAEYRRRTRYDDFPLQSYQTLLDLRRRL